MLSGPAPGVPEVTVCAAVSAFFQIMVSKTSISIIPVVLPSFSLCQKYGALGSAAPVGILMSYVFCL
jgi:hypothetical protein